jgi:amidophosphoribosyltransferase
MGHNLAQKITEKWVNHDIDVVIPIPDTSRTSALELAITLGVPYREGYIKNRYIGRTFIMPGQTQRKKSVRRKLNPLDIEFKGKNVLLVDDSIVRGTTSREIVQMARDSGAKKVYFASASPAIRYPNIYGIDMPAADELIAHGRSDDEVAEAIGADKIIYQELGDLIDSITEGNPNLTTFDCSVFTGEYVTGETEDYFNQLKERRSDAAKEHKNNELSPIDLVSHD